MCNNNLAYISSYWKVLFKIETFLSIQLLSIYVGVFLYKQLWSLHWIPPFNFVFPIMLTGFGVNSTGVLIWAGPELIFFIAAMFWICAESSVDSSEMFKPFLSSVCTDPWGGWVGTQLGQRDISYHLCSAIKAGGRKEGQWWHLSFQVTITC